MKKSILSALLLIASSFMVFAQSYGPNPNFPQPEIDKPLPAFTLNNIHYYKSIKASSDDFKGKWLFLDFWFPGCIPCIKSFPKVNKFQEKFKDKALFLLVGMNNYPGTEKTYEVNKKQYDLKLSIAYDSLLIQNWGIHSMPHIIIVDPKGIVRHITGGRDITEDKIQAMVEGKKVSFYPKGGYGTEEQLDSAMAARMDTSSFKEKIFYQSTLKAHTSGIQLFPPSVKDYLLNAARPGFQIAQAPLGFIYNYAYFGKGYWFYKDAETGKIYPTPILEIQDTSLFKYDFIKEVGKGTFDYDLTIPRDRATEQYVRQVMKKDLENIFSYEAKIERRKMPVWKITSDDTTLGKIKSKGGKALLNVSRKTNASGMTILNFATGFELINYPSDNLCYYLTKHLEPTLNVFIDETKITGNIDIKIDAAMTDLNAVRKELQKYGMNLVRGEKEMDVLVIRDLKPQSKN